MDNLGVKFELRGVKEALNLFSPKVVSKAVRYALDRSGKAIKTDITKEISKGYNIKQKDIREKIRIGKAVNIGRDNELKITIKGSRIPLSKFRLSEQGKGIVAQIKKGEGTYYERGFYHGTKVTGKRAFQRKGKESYPIWTLYGPSVPQLAGSEYIYKAVQRIFRERMQKDFNHGIDYYSGLVKAGGHWVPEE